MPVTPPLAQPEVTLLDSSSVHRRLTIKPAMCGHNTLFVSQLGDWTWDTVTAACGTDVFNARNEAGAPTYLAFYYFHIRATPRVHLRRFTFGDRLSVDSTVFGFGSESVLTLHRIALGGDGPGRPIDPLEFFDAPRDDCMYVQNFNRWITRGRDGGNRNLVRSSPTDFTHEHLPALPERYSPRHVYQRARAAGTFHDATGPGWRAGVEDFELIYPIDITRDINGVGLIYYAAYFSVVDWALLRLWRHLGRDDRTFLARVVVDHKMCYLGNAQLDSVLRIRMKTWENRDDPTEEVVNVLIEDQETTAVLAVSTLTLRHEDRA
ncbi:LnmK family bifunctional acyltransferase/decarboxylase [Micromonospora tulbaghiae]|uniref:LnmK family bifunctional acyltransferase/decarboxylase n=1 Tax=Micromonospora tulbaghiae TaxID=479978 RepID=UPI00365F95FB